MLQSRAGQKVSLSPALLPPVRREINNFSVLNIFGLSLFILTAVMSCSGVLLNQLYLAEIVSGAVGTKARSGLRQRETTSSDGLQTLGFHRVRAMY